MTRVRVMRACTLSPGTTIAYVLQGSCSCLMIRRMPKSRPRWHRLAHVDSELKNGVIIERPIMSAHYMCNVLSRQHKCTQAAERILELRKRMNRLTLAQCTAILAGAACIVTSRVQPTGRPIYMGLGVQAGGHACIYSATCTHPPTHGAHLHALQRRRCREAARHNCKTPRYTGILYRDIY